MKQVKHKKLRGYSLIELMISLALGSIVTAGVVQLFVANSETHALLVGQSRMQESARFAIDFISRDVRQAGYSGCFSNNDEIHSTIRPESNIPYEFDLRFGIQGFDATGLNSWTPALSLLPNTAADLPVDNVLNRVFKTSYGYGMGSGIDLDALVSGTDLITMRHLSQTNARLGGYSNGGGTVYATMPNSSEQPVVGVRAGWAEFDLDHIVLIHDCEKASLFRVTTANPWGRNTNKSPKAVAVNTDLTIGHDIADTDPTRNSFVKLALVNTFGTDASVSAIQTNTFFIAPGQGLNNLGNTPLSLWRKSGLSAPVELVEGVENLQILYGVDTNSNRIPNQYLQANLVVDWTEVVMVRITVVVNSIDGVGSTSAPSHGCEIQSCVVDETFDGLIRRTFSQTIQLRNHG